MNATACERVTQFSLNYTPEISVRVKGGKSLRNGMWNGVRNGILMRNTIYAGNKLIEERILFSRQFYKSSSFFRCCGLLNNQTTDRGLENVRLG